MATKIEMRHQSFWQQVFISSIRAGNHAAGAAATADLAVTAYIERTEAKPQ